MALYFAHEILTLIKDPKNFTNRGNIVLLDGSEAPTDYVGQELEPVAFSVPGAIAHLIKTRGRTDKRFSEDVGKIPFFMISEMVRRHTLGDPLIYEFPYIAVWAVQPETTHAEALEMVQRAIRLLQDDRTQSSSG